MTVIVKTFVPTKQIENTQTTQYTAVNCRAIIDKFTVTNVGISNETISVNLVTNGGSAALANVIVDSRAVAPGETYTFPEMVGQVLEPGGSISTIASAASVLNLRISGREIT